MKKSSTSQSAASSLRLITSASLLLAGVLLVALGLSQFSAQAQPRNSAASNSIDPLVPAGFDCSKIQALGIDRQENLRAGALMIYCGLAEGGSADNHGQTSPFVQNLLAPLLGGTDVNLITDAESFPNVTQSETFVAANPDNPAEIVVAYNDSKGRNANPINISGASVSLDGGATFTRVIRASTNQSPFANTLGDPVILYNKPTATWYTVWLDVGCGGQGLGGYKSATPTDPDSWTHYCVHTSSGDDRESGWADNNPSSPFYGRMYVSWNDFGVGGNLKVRYTTDNGATWTNERQLAGASPFMRDVQITGDAATGFVYVASMDEMGGGLGNRANVFYKSTDGGNSWAKTYTGPNFPAPGRTLCPNTYFACMFPSYWRHMGWGQPGVLNNVVHYVYDSRNTSNGDPADSFYIRSTDGGVTFSAPFKLNTDTTTKAQWQPNLSVGSGNTLLAVWYDERNATQTCVKGSTSVPCYQMFARKSNDGGLTWGPDEPLSDVVTPLPGQPDPGIVAEYAGDYDYSFASPLAHIHSWTDGRLAISGQSQQDAFADRELVGFSVTNTDPACGSVISNQPTDFVVNLTDAVDPATVQSSDFTVNGTPADSFTLGGGDTQITFHFTSSPVTTQGPQAMHIPAGAFNSASDNAPNLEFTCTFTYDAVLLQVVSTVPAVGGTFSPAAPNDYDYDVNFNEPVDVASVQTSDLTVTGSSGPTVTGVSVINGSMTARFTLHMNSGGSLEASIPAGAITDQFGNPGAAFSGNYTVEGTVCGWTPGPDMPSVGVRSVGVYFPANGKFYAMGGRSSDDAGSDFTHPFEYDPATNAWTTKSATYPDNQVNNMACGLLTDAGTPYIYCVGGSAAGATTAASRVFRYDPAADVISTVAAPWPGAMGTILPGGFSVYSNKLYILGGFNINVGMVDRIYEFTPSPAGWVQKTTVLPTALGYIPTATIGNLIYTAGGSTWDGTTIHDSAFSFVYDPGADTIGNIANIPRATAETRALNFNSQMLVMGGGRDAPNPSNEVDVYDPGTNTWSTSIPPFVEPRRNFPTDTDGMTRIWLAGGYAPTSPVSSMEIFECTGGGGGITLSAEVKTRQGESRVVLTWSPAVGGEIDVIRNNRVHTTEDDGRAVDNTGNHTGTATYQVCKGDDCSNVVEVMIP